MTLTDHPVIASMRDERDVEVPTYHPEVEMLGAFLIEDAEGPYDAQHLRSVPHACYCTDGRHRDERDREAVNPDGWLREDAHPITVHVYVVIAEETDPSMPRDGNRDLRGDEINKIRQDLDKRSPEKVKKVERQARNAAARDSAMQSYGDEKDRKGLFGTIFGRDS